MSHFTKRHNNVRVRSGVVLAAGLMIGASGASAATVVFDFGLLGANGNPPCSSGCVLPTNGENFFTAAGVTVGAIGYSAGGAVKYVTQKPGAFAANGGETGIGESDTFPSASDPDFEVTTSTWLLIDNAAAFAAGYQSASFSIESLQSGEGAKVFGYTGALDMLDSSKLFLLATLSAPLTGGVTQTIAVPIDSKYLVVQGYTPPGGSKGADIVVAQEVLSTAAVPEPASWAMMITGFGLMGAGLRRRRMVMG